MTEEIQEISEITGNTIMHSVDPVARIIPLVIDYLLEFEVAEEKSIAEIL